MKPRADKERPGDRRRRQLADRLADLCHASGPAEVLLWHQERGGGRVGGPLKCAKGGVEKAGQVDVPCLKLAGQEHEGNKEGTEPGAAVAEKHDQATIPTIGEQADEWREGDIGHDPDHHVEGEKGRRAGRLVNPDAQRKAGQR